MLRYDGGSPLTVAALGLLAVLVSGVSSLVEARALPDAAAASGGMATSGGVAATGGVAALGAVLAGETLQVAIKPLEPFVARVGTDRYSGFSIDVWNEVARRNSWNVRYRWYDELPTALADVQAGKVDVAVAGISITRQREEVVDFSYPMFNSGLEVLTSTTGSGSAWGSTRRPGWGWSATSGWETRNATLLDMRDDGTYDEIYAKYFGAARGH